MLVGLEVRERFLYEQRAILEIMDRTVTKILLKHEDFISANFHDNRKFEEFMSELRWVTDDKLLPQELEFKNDCNPISDLYADLRTLKEKYDAELDIVFRSKGGMPIFVERHPVLRAKWEEIQKDIIDNMMEFKDVSLIVYIPA